MADCDKLSWEAREGSGASAGAGTADLPWPAHPGNWTGLGAVRARLSCAVAVRFYIRTIWLMIGLLGNIDQAACDCSVVAKCVLRDIYIVIL
jgi:hypothetical protein